jgi:hypothetical protein
MREKYPLLPALSDVNSATLTAFFVDTLQIKNVSYKNLTDELAYIKTYIKRQSTTNIENIHDIYTKLQIMASFLSAAERDIIR